MTAPDPDLMRKINRQFVTGVTVVTTMDGSRPRGLAVNAFANVSLDPPTVIVAVQHTSSTHESLFQADYLAINTLSVDQLDVVHRFASKSENKFADLDWTCGPNGSPLIGRSAATMEARMLERLQASTHTIFVCRVLSAAVHDRAPMIYTAGKFSDGGVLTALK
jgi:flavin reductase (DIM6/NTAB) family NADH-FMN oxidoreductase RutF